MGLGIVGTALVIVLVVYLLGGLLWPQYWSDNWYGNDDMYIDYSGDGYYLYNRRYPRDRISVSVFLN